VFVRFPLFVLAAGLLGTLDVKATTYYLAGTGADSNSCASAQMATAPKATFASAWGCLNAGDTLIVQNGTYTNASPPSGKQGTASAPITLQAAVDGGSVISGTLSLVNVAYLNFTGFKVTSPNASVYARSAGRGLVTHHVAFRRCGFQTTTTAEDGGVDFSDGTHHMLIEDSWAWGGGRYTISCYGGPGGSPPNLGCDYNTYRRIVIRMGPASSAGGNPEASLALYYASNNIVENVIAVDGVQDSDSSNAAFYLTAHGEPPQVSGNKFYGVIAMNNRGEGWYLDHNGTGGENELRNSILWKNGGGAISLYASMPNQCANNIIDHVTAGGTGNGSDAYWNGCNGTTVNSSIFMNAVSYGMKQSPGGGSTGVHNYNLMWSNTAGDYDNISSGTKDILANPQLKYLTRVEAVTPCSSAGEGGTNCGADVTFRYQDGAPTATPLWPWPNEARIYKDMCTDARVTTGFCSAGSITAYIWTALGNPVPSSIPVGTTPSPMSPCDLTSDRLTNNSDTAIAVSQILSQTACTTADINRDGKCNVVDLQRIVNASLGQGCNTNP
jgi:hypothetical protein